jgi:hypothetical protein
MSSLLGFSYLQKRQLDELKNRLTKAVQDAETKTTLEEYGEDMVNLDGEDGQHFTNIENLKQIKADKVELNSRVNELIGNDTRHEETMNQLEIDYSGKVSQLQFNNMVAELRANDDSQDARLDLLEQQFDEIQVRIKDEIVDKANELVETTDFNAMIATLQAGDTGLHNQIIQLASTETINTALSSYQSSLNNLQDKTEYDAEIDKLISRNVDFEKRLLAVDQFFKVMAETYKLHRDGTEVVYTADYQTGLVIAKKLFDAFGRRTGRVIVKLSSYAYNSMTGKIGVVGSGEEVGKSGFNEITYNGTLLLPSPVVYPIQIVLKSQGGTTLETVSLTNSQYLALDNFSSVNISYSVNTINKNVDDSVNIPAPTNSGLGTVGSYAVLSNNLPGGLTLNADGSITGIATESVSGRVVTIRAYNIEDNSEYSDFNITFNITFNRSFYNLFPENLNGTTIPSGLPGGYRTLIHTFTSGSAGAYNFFFSTLNNFTDVGEFITKVYKVDTTNNMLLNATDINTTNIEINNGTVVFKDPFFTNNTTTPQFKLALEASTQYYIECVTAFNDAGRDVGVVIENNGVVVSISGVSTNTNTPVLNGDRNSLSFTTPILAPVRLAMMAPNSAGGTSQYVLQNPSPINATPNTLITQNFSSSIAPVFNNLYYVNGSNVRITSPIELNTGTLPVITTDNNFTDLSLTFTPNIFPLTNVTARVQLLIGVLWTTRDTINITHNTPLTVNVGDTFPVQKIRIVTSSDAILPITQEFDTTTVNIRPTLNISGTRPNLILSFTPLANYGSLITQYSINDGPWNNFGNVITNYTIGELINITHNNIPDEYTKVRIITNANMPLTNEFDLPQNIDWYKKGADIDGKATGDQSGYSVSLSADGNTVAIGANRNDGNTNNSTDNRGHVRVYTWNGSAWVPKGADIDGEAMGDQSGISVSLSADGNTVAIGAYLNDGNGSDSGHVRVYTWNGSVWAPKGDDIDGDAANDWSGCSVSLSADGNTVAIGAAENDGNINNSTDNRGHVRVYIWNGSVWTPKGADIDGEDTGDASGVSVSLSADGNTVAIGAVENDGNTNNSTDNRGHVRVYTWNGSAWVPKGADIDGEATGDESGYSVSLSADGNTVAIGAYLNDGNDSNSGHVRVYNWNGSAWVPKGVDIDGEAMGDQSGYSVSLSADGNTVAIGAIHNDGNGSSSGHVRVYTWNGIEWLRKNIDINGESGSNSGNSVSLSANGNTVAIGAIFNNQNGIDSGSVRVYYYGVLPSAPTGLVATPGDGQVSIAFNAGPDGGIAITNYKYSIDNGATYTAFSPADTTSPVVITGLTSGTTYQIKLRAINEIGDGAESLTVSATAATVPSAPTGLAATPGDGQVSIAFTAGSNGGSAITNYKYSIDNGATYIAFSPVDTTSPVVITGLTSGTTYQIKLRAVNEIGDGAESLAVSATPMIPMSSKFRYIGATPYVIPEGESVLATATASNGDVYIGGNFTSVNGITCSAIARWNVIANEWQPLFNSNGVSQGVFFAIPPTIRTIAIDSVNNFVYVGGTFTSAGGQTARGVARWSIPANGSVGSWTPLLHTDNANGTEGGLNSIAIYNGYVYAAGNFSSVGGIALNNIARWLIPASGNVGTWSALLHSNGTSNGTSQRINSVAIDTVNNFVYVGGDFDAVANGNVSARRIARWNINTPEWSSPEFFGLNGNVNTVAIHNGFVYVGGVFTTTSNSGGPTLSRVARFNISTGVFSPLLHSNGSSQGFSNPVNALAFVGSDVYIGGQFTASSGIISPRIIKWSIPATGNVGAYSAITDDDNNKGVDNTVNTISVYGSNIYIGGSFRNTSGGTTIYPIWGIASIPL